MANRTNIIDLVRMIFLIALLPLSKYKKRLAKLKFTYLWHSKVIIFGYLLVQLFNVRKSGYKSGRASVGQLTMKHKLGSTYRWTRFTVIVHHFRQLIVVLVEMIGWRSWSGRRRVFRSTLFEHFGPLARRENVIDGKH